MKLHEYQSKQLFGKYGVPVPQGRVTNIPSEARRIADEIGLPVVVKSQVLVGGRGKAGGIKLAKTLDDVEQHATDILSMEIKGLPVRKVLIDPAADIKHEIYLGVTNDRAARRPVMICSAAGGVDIEEVAAKTPDKIIRVHVDPFIGLRDYQARQLAAAIDLSRDHWRQFVKIARGLYDAFIAVDATLAEINPLVITPDGLLAVDGKVDVDDNSLFRHPDLAEMRDVDAETASEQEARANDLSYVQLDGEIGCMVNGAGLAMATMDIVSLKGGSPANFLDVGGGASADKVAAAFRIILRDSNVKAVLINIFGGITRGDEVARGILAAMEEVQVDVPMVVRLVGTNAEEGLQLLAEADMMTANTLSEAAEKIVAVVKGGAA